MLSLLQEARDCTNIEAWRELVSQCKPLLYGWLRRHDIQQVDAEDLVQETLATLALEAPAFQLFGHPRAFRCWLYKVLTNRLRDFRRSQRVRSICHSDSRLLDGLADFIHDDRSNLKRQLDHDHDSEVALSQIPKQIGGPSLDAAVVSTNVARLIQRRCKCPRESRSAIAHCPLTSPSSAPLQDRHFLSRFFEFGTRSAV